MTGIVGSSRVVETTSYPLVPYRGPQLPATVPSGDGLGATRQLGEAAYTKQTFATATHDIAQRFDDNPILRPGDVKPSRPDMVVEGLFNPGVFRYQGRIGMLMRVAERPRQEDGFITVPVRDASAPGGMRILRFDKHDPDVSLGNDSRVFRYKGEMVLTTLSHLRLAWSDDGVHFTPEDEPTLLGDGPYESYGMEDCRVSQIGGTYHLTYSAVSANGVCAGLITTRDWRHFDRHGLVFGPHNKDVALLEQPVDGQYVALNRPSGVDIGGNYMWVSRSPDLTHWGEHQILARTRPGSWDSERVGAGAAPIPTRLGLLEIYHGASKEGGYCLGALLLDRHDPSKVLARSEQPIMAPAAPYEQQGFFGNVVFTNGHVVDGDQLTIYYGASDSIICGARFSIEGILQSLVPKS